MEELIVYHVERTLPFPLTISGFADTILVSLGLPAGSYVVHGRLGIRNNDSDPQDASVGIRTRSSLQYSDRIDTRLAPDQVQIYISLQAVVTLPERDTLDLTAGTYLGFVNNFSLIAIGVDRIEPPV